MHLNVSGVIKITKLKVQTLDNTIEWFQALANETGNYYLGHIGTLRTPIMLVKGDEPEPRQISFTRRIDSPLIGIGVSMYVSNGVPYHMTAVLEKERKNYGKLEVKLQGLEAEGVKVLDTPFAQKNPDIVQRETPEGTVLSHADLVLPEMQDSTYFYFHGGRGRCDEYADLSVHFAGRVDGNHTVRISEDSHKKLPPEYFARVTNGFGRVLEAIVNNLVGGDGEEYTIYLNTPALKMNNKIQRSLRRAKLSSDDIATIDNLVHPRNAALMIQQQDLGGSLGASASIGEHRQSGPRKLVSYGLIGALYKGGFSDVIVSHSGPDLPDLEQAEKLGSDISQKLGTERSGLGVIGYPFNSLSPHSEGLYSLDARVLMPEKEVILGRKGVTLVPKEGFPLVEAPISTAINNLNMLQWIHTYDYLQSLEAIARGNFLAHFSATHDGDIGPVAAISHYLRLMGLNVGLVCFDAHGDYNSYSTSPSGNLHGMHLAIATFGNMSKSYLARLGSIDTENPERKINPKNLLHVGGRAFDELELELMRRDGVNIFTMPDILYSHKQGMLPQKFAEKYHVATQGVDAVMVSIDYDVLDPNADFLKNEKLAVYMPEKDGLHPEYLKTMLRVIAQGRIPVLGIFGSELTPRPDIFQWSEDLEVSGKSFAAAVDIVQDFFTHYNLSNYR